MKIIYSIIITLVSAVALHAGTLVTFDAEVKSRIEHDGGKTNTVERYGSKVFLGVDVIDVEADSRITVYDYKDRKIYRSAADKEGFIKGSLFSDIGFRVSEFQNRLFLGNALRAADIQDNPMDRVLMEHLFSLSSGEAANLERKENKSSIVFKHNGKLLLEYSCHGTKVSQETVEKFTLYMRTTFGIHPDILKKICELNYIPEQITLCRYNTTKIEEIHLSLKQVQRDFIRPERKLQTEIIPDDDPVFALALQVREMDVKAYTTACKSILKRAPLLAGKEKYLDAAALFVGYGLASGQQTMPQMFFEWKDKIVADSDVQAMFSALSPQSKEDAEKAVETCAALAEKADDGRFALMIFRANMLDSLGKPYEAVESFLVALTQEPAIVGAWKDLGDIYYNIYQSEKAWVCWDAGRALNPKHKLFEAVYKMEMSLLADHSEFFMKIP